MISSVGKNEIEAAITDISKVVETAALLFENCCFELDDVCVDKLKELEGIVNPVLDFALAKKGLV